MNFLLIILSVMTWTIKDKHSVTGDGTQPYGVVTSYSCTNSKGTVRANDEAVLTLSQLGGVTIDKVEVYVKSNKTGGAGVFTVSLNGTKITTKSGSLKDWFGAFDNDAFHALTLLSTSCQAANQLEVSLQGTANTLYIEKYVITWSPAAPRTVTLMKGAESLTQLTETEGGAGVLLPDVEDLDTWTFIGWTNWEFWAIHFKPTLFPANSVYYPSKNTTLWAVYAYQHPTLQRIATELTSGEYLYVNRKANIALTGVPDENGRMTHAQADETDEEQFYTIELVTDSTAYITHTVTQIPIGYSDALKIVPHASLWKIYHQDEESIFYTEIKGKKYVLWLNIEDLQTREYYAGLQPANSVTPSPMVLMLPNPLPEEPVFTCHPEGNGIHFVPAQQSEPFVLRFGNYRLIIKDGKKSMQL